MTKERTESQSDYTDLKCAEHISDTETDSQSEEETLIENKVSPAANQFIT